MTLGGEYSIPTANSVCPCCGILLTIDDVKNKPCVYIGGNIIMDWRKRVISIEWQENYKTFDMDRLFSAEDVTKWKNAENVEFMLGVLKKHLNISKKY